MERVLENLSPKSVFTYFEDLTRIPRCSGDEKKVSDYLVDFAKERNLEVIQDEALNIIIRKPGTKGYENAPTVILQGHMDMVCEKNKGTKHDFSKDPLNLRIKDDMIWATDTTLGADNGIAVAYCLAILDSNDIPHPPLEILVTTEEETGMGGANQLNPNNLKGKTLINIDSEEEGVLLVSCAGGVRNKVHIPIEYSKVEKDLLPYTLKLRGLKGGHSGMEINKERGNANKLMGRILYSIESNFDISLSDINGGAKMNAIPREIDATILIDSSHKEDLENEVNNWNRIFKNELKTSDPGVYIGCDFVEDDIERAFSKKTTKKVISALMLMPNGIQSMSMDIEGLVESSTNLGVVTTAEDKVVLESAIRSSVRTLKDDIATKIETMAKLIDAEVTNEASYPEWEYKKDSYIREVFVNVYENIFGKKPEITAIHAGLECGLFGEKLGDVDMISFGPNMFDVHTPDEHLSISSTQRMWKYLLGVLKEIK
ncbi:aminoacyl-histidine dipeptidase [Dethiothermospora halolimnae]|uniref:aminoacyl-histidine dipeptidase n=1 Tax=Dethiothermospora halolimnae TaxID=3114390 RepID=UPI003CCC0975